MLSKYATSSQISWHMPLPVTARAEPDSNYPIVSCILHLNPLQRSTSTTTRRCSIQRCCITSVLVKPRRCDNPDRCRKYIANRDVSPPVGHEPRPDVANWLVIRITIRGRPTDASPSTRHPWPTKNHCSGVGPVQSSVLIPIAANTSPRRQR